MATGSNNLTTYYAKRIIGDTAAATPANALLQIGTGLNRDNWLLHKTNRTDTYGIKYVYDYDSSRGSGLEEGTEDRIELYGGYQVSSTDTPTAWIQLDTGDIYTIGSIGIGTNSAENYKLYVNGTGFFSGFLTISVNGESGIQICDGKYYNDNTFRVVLDLNPDSGNHGIYSSGYSNGTTFTSDGKWLLVRSSDGSVQMNGNAATATQAKVTNFSFPSSGSQTNYVILSGSTITGNQDLKNTSHLYLWENTTSSYLNVGASGTMGAITLHNGTGIVNIVPATLTADTTRTLTIQDASGTVCLTDGTGASGSWDISVTGSSASCTGNALTCSYPYGFSSKTDNATWGNTTGTSIVAWNDSTGGSIAFRRDNPSSGKMSIKVDGRFYGNEGTYPAMLMNYTNGYWGMGDPDAGATVWIRTTNQGIIPYQSGNKGGGHQYLGTSTWYFAYAYIDTITSNKTYGAVWNDIAECRHTVTKEAGRVMVENASGIMELSSKRMQSTGRIISDTYGYCMGEPANDGTPIAIAGRVLVYPYRSIKEYNLGDCVCAAPNGTVDIMTREEIKEYPDRIIGTVSEIPTYEVWSGGAQNGNDDIQVNGRIWIYVR